MSKYNIKAKQTFAEKAISKHGGKYDYSRVEYLTAKQKVTIVCYAHGVFLQTPSDHLNGYGCPTCGREKRGLTQRNTVQDFINRARLIVGDRYDYSLVEYVGLRTKVKIICPTHGVFEMTPGTHLKGRYCSKCTGRAFIPTEEFIAQAKNAHRGKYDYSLVDCQHNRKPVKIICRDHGVFEQAPRSHLMGSGCEQCASAQRGLQKRSKASEQFLAKARKVHGNLYDYSSASYIQNDVNVTIGCSVHGMFQQTPANHLMGRGCPSCSTTGFDPAEPAILYYLSINDGQAYKIGITNRTIDERFSSEDLRKITIIGKWHFDYGYLAREKEAQILKRHSSKKYKGPPLLSNGNSELFSCDIQKFRHLTGF